MKSWIEVVCAWQEIILLGEPFFISVIGAQLYQVIRSSGLHAAITTPWWSLSVLVPQSVHSLDKQAFDGYLSYGHNVARAVSLGDNLMLLPCILTSAFSLLLQNFFRASVFRGGLQHCWHRHFFLLVSEIRFTCFGRSFLNTVNPTFEFGWAALNASYASLMKQVMLWRGRTLVYPLILIFTAADLSGTSRLPAGSR